MTADTVTSYYDRNARHYDRRWSNYLARTLTFLKSRIVVRPQTVILDVGCGTGQFESLILSERPEQQMAGVDISDEMLKVATTKCQSFPNVTFHRADAAALPFADQTFDLVVSASAFHYFAKPAASLAEMRRVVKSDGSVILLDWCRDYFFCRLFDGILRLVESGYQKCYTRCELHRLLEETPFQIQSFDRVRFGVIWGLMIAEVVRSRLEAETAYLQSDGMEFRDDNLEHFEAHGAPSRSAFSTEGFVEHDRARIWYATSGSGSPVILLHGGLGHSGNWGYQVPALASAG